MCLVLEGWFVECTCSKVTGAGRFVLIAVEGAWKRYLWQQSIFLRLAELREKPHCSPARWLFLRVLCRSFIFSI